MVWARRITSEKLMECQYREGYARSLEGMGVDNNGEVKRAMVESASMGLRDLGEKTQRVCGGTSR